MDLTIWQYVAVGLLGVFASIINMMAGGGSNLVLPLLMMLQQPLHRRNRNGTHNRRAVPL